MIYNSLNPKSGNSAVFEFNSIKVLMIKKQVKEWEELNCRP